MSDNFNIDELFEGSLGGMKQKPKEMSWDNIEQELDSSTPSETQFDNMVAASMAGFSVNPSSSAWSDINIKLDNIDSLNKEFDSKVEESINNMRPQASRTVWDNIEQELDVIDAYRIAERRKFVSWFTAAGTVAAVFIYFMLQIQPNINFRNRRQNQLVNKSVINDLKQNSSRLTNNSEYSNYSENTIINKKTIGNNKTTVNKNFNIVDKTNFKNGVPKINTTEKRNKEKLSEEKAGLSVNIVDANDKKAVEKINIVENNSETRTVATNNITSAADNSINNIVNIRMKSNNLINNDKLLARTTTSSTSFQSLPTTVRVDGASKGFSFDLFGGPEYIHSPSEITYNEADNIIIKKKSAYIKDYSFGANVKYNFNKLFIQSGLVYSNFGDILSLNQQNELHDTSGGYYSFNINTYYTYDTLRWEEDPLQSGVLVPVLSSNMHTDTVITNWNSSDSLCYENELASAETRYRYIEIPLMLGYQLTYKDWGFLLSAGVSVGFKVSDEAEYTSNNKLSDLDKLSTPYSDSNINGIVSLGLSYSISDKISVILQPTYKTNLTGFTAHSTRYQSISIRCGINVKL